MQTNKNFHAIEGVSGVFIRTWEYCACKGDIQINGNIESITAFGDIMREPLAMSDYGHYVTFKPFSTKDMRGLAALYGLTTHDIETIQKAISERINGGCIGCE